MGTEPPYVENPEAIGDPNQTPRVRLTPLSPDWYKGYRAALADSALERAGLTHALTTTDARAERAEAALARVRELAEFWSLSTVAASADWLASRLVAALDGAGDAQRSAEGASYQQDVADWRDLGLTVDDHSQLPAEGGKELDEERSTEAPLDWRERTMRIVDDLRAAPPVSSGTGEQPPRRYAIAGPWEEFEPSAGEQPQEEA